jgi:tyrosine-protein kinase Etk/Wzc
VLGRRRKVPVVGQPPGPSAGADPGRLRRSELQAFGSLLAELDGDGVVLVTGEPGGKCSAAVAIATAASAAGRRVALVECDLADPRLAASLDLAPAPGLHEYLRWDVEAAQILQALVLAGPGSGAAEEPLVCVVAGEPTASGAVLLSAESFRHAVERLRGAYELVVLCAPSLEEAPLLALVAERADVALAAIGRSAASGRRGRRLKRAMRRLPVPKVGLVLYEAPAQVP